jgi:hypothetical protein
MAQNEPTDQDWEAELKLLLWQPDSHLQGGSTPEVKEKQREGRKEVTDFRVTRQQFSSLFNLCRGYC